MERLLLLACIYLKAYIHTWSSDLGEAMSRGERGADALLLREIRALVGNQYRKEPGQGAGILAFGLA